MIANFFSYRYNSCRALCVSKSEICFWIREIYFWVCFRGKIRAFVGSQVLQKVESISKQWNWKFQVIRYIVIGYNAVNRGSNVCWIGKVPVSDSETHKAGLFSYWKNPWIQFWALHRMLLDIICVHCAPNIDIRIATSARITDETVTWEVTWLSWYVTGPSWEVTWSTRTVTWCHSLQDLD